MTASTMLCCRSSAESTLRKLLHALLVWALVGLTGLAGLAYAGNIEPVNAALAAGDDSYLLSADFQVELGSHFEEAVSRGVPLYFVLEFDLTRSRSYWANEHIAGKTINYRLSYTALTRQYRLSRGGLHQNFSTLNEALRVLGRIVALPVVDKAALKTGESYQAALRLSLDRQQLPKPFQVDAIANADWQVEAKVLRWQFTQGGHTTK